MHRASVGAGKSDPLLGELRVDRSVVTEPSLSLFTASRARGRRLVEIGWPPVCTGVVLGLEDVTIGEVQVGVAGLRVLMMRWQGATR